MKRETMLKRFDGWTLHKCVQTVARDLQLLVRLESADMNGFVSCCSCGMRDHYKKMNGGHYVSRKFKATILDRENVHAQCVRCNIIDNLPGYTSFLCERYRPGFSLELMARARNFKQWSKPELVDLRIEFRKEIKEHKKRIGIK